MAIVSDGGGGGGFLDAFGSLASGGGPPSWGAGLPPSVLAAIGQLASQNAFGGLGGVPNLAALSGNNLANLYGGGNSSPQPLAPPAAPGQDPAVARYLDALNQQKIQQAQQNWMQQYIQQTAGSPPPQYQPQDFGPQPTFSFDDSGYAGARNAVNAGNNTALAQDRAAYAAAIKDQQGLNATSVAQAKQYVGNATQDATNAGNAENAAISAATAGGTPGSSLDLAMHANQATLNAGNQRGIAAAKFMQQLSNQDATNSLSTLGTGQASSIANLSAAVQGELSRIGLAEGAAKQNASQQFQNVLRQWQMDNSNAKINAYNANTKSQYDYQSNVQKAIGQLPSTPSQILQWSINNGQVDPNTAGALNVVLNGAPGSSDPNLMGQARDMPQAIARIKASGLDPNTQRSLVFMAEEHFTKTRLSTAQIEQWAQQNLSGTQNGAGGY